MRIVDFLCQLLEAHAETLRRLAALLGEEALLELLENAGDTEQAVPERGDAFIERTASRLLAPQRSGGSAYQQLEGAVHEFGLPAVLEFHLWAYPHYRAFIESPIDLESRIPGPGGDTGTALVEEAVAQAQAWVRHLPLPSQLGLQAERAAHVPWLRFRTNVLKRIGRRPMGPVY
ncbi:MAG: hypothetical protein NDJ90_00390 [Oligoflexia bacterium]|nr:hypothetical protein [Oligoflexia bacterium]